MINEVIYSRQNLIEDLNIPDIATVVGVGGTGFWTAIFLAMSGVKELVLIDSDNIEKSNLNRLPLTENSIGEKKIVAAKEYISKLRNNCRIEIHDLKIDNATACSIIRGDVFCCTDNLTSQQLICAYAKKNSLPYQRIGYDGTILNISEAFPLSFEEKETQTGYTVTPSWVIPAVFSAAAGVCSKLYKKLHIMDDIGKVHILNSSSIPKKLIEEIGEKAADEREESIKDSIDDYIPDDYGYCGDCNRVDVENNRDYGYCPDCNKEYSEENVEEREEEARDEKYSDILKQIEDDDIEEPELEKAINTYAMLKTDFKLDGETQKDLVRKGIQNIIKNIYLAFDNNSQNYYGDKMDEQTNQIMYLITDAVKNEIKENKND